MGRIITAVESEKDVRKKCDLIKVARDYKNSRTLPRKQPFNGQLKSFNDRLKKQHEAAKKDLSKIAKGMTCGGLATLESWFESTSDGSDSQ